MSVTYNISEKGINSVLILDDDWAINCNKKELEAIGISQEHFKKLEDEEDPSTEELIDLLESKGKPFESLEEKLKGLFCNDLLGDIPKPLLETIVVPAKQRKEPLRAKLEAIAETLQSLGLADDKICRYSTFAQAREHLQNNSPDLFIIDLFIEDEDQDKTLEFIESLLDSHNESQFILMSYNIEELTKLFRRFHKEKNVPSSKFKVIAKPQVEGEAREVEQLKWQNAFYQLSNERSIVVAQSEMQSAWAQSIDRAASSLKGKIWELDSCSLNKLSLTARADNMKLSEYLPEIISKHILSEFESSGSPTRQINQLEERLGELEDYYTFSSSVEVSDAYEILRGMLADTISHRGLSIKQFSDMTITEENKGDEYKKFLADLKFGSVLKHKENGELLIHITQPCDYIHVPYKKSDDESLLLFPGKEMSLYKEEPPGNKKFITPYIRISEDITSVKWNLRRPKTFSILELFKQKNEYEIVGKVRDDYTQAISNSFASAVSRVAMIRIPRFEYMDAYHLFYNAKDHQLYLKTDGDDVPLSKKKLPISSGTKFKARRYKLEDATDKRHHRIIFPSDDAVHLSKSFNGISTSNLTMELLQGANLGDEADTRIDQRNNIMFSYIEGLKGNLTMFLEEAKKLHETSGEILNLVLLEPSDGS